MAKRKSGNATIRVTLNFSSVDFAARVAVDGKHVWSGTIGAPAVGFGEGVAYDSPEAYDEVARSALSFAEDEVEDADIAYEVETIDGVDRIKVERV